MKRMFPIIVVALLIIAPLIVASLAASAEAESYTVPVPAAIAEEAGPEAVDPTPEPVVPGEPLTWEYLATIAGASALTLLIVQFLKVPLDSVFHIPTRVLVYVIALAIMLTATALTSGLTVDNALLVCVNAVIAAVTAYGAYEVTFAKISAKKDARPTVNIT